LLRAKHFDYAPGVVGAKRGQTKSSGGRGRFSLVLFTAIFVLLFVGFAIAQGIGGPSVPAGAVAVVREVPEELGTVTKEDFDRAFAQQLAQNAVKKTPEPGSDKYEEMKEAALGELFKQIWILGSAEELGLTVTDKQVATQLKKIKEESFPTPAKFNKFLKESGYNLEDVDRLVRLQLLGTQIQEFINAAAPKPTKLEIAEYYEAEKAEKFTEKASRDVRLVLNKDKSKVEAAKAELEKDSSPANWKKVAGKYSEDSSTKASGGLQAGVQEEFLQGEVKEAVFDNPSGELVGPVKFETGYLLIETVKLNPAKTKPLGKVREEIGTTLTQEKQQEAFGEFVLEYQTKWTGRTYCAEGYVIKECSNYTAAHPENAPPACYEANPKKAPTECPAPVTQTKPALPGTITPLKPKGEQLVQRPLPEASAASGELPAGAAPEGAEVEPEASGE
jgi:parvulin-like peptidyl-prolyl isomerase